MIKSMIVTLMALCFIAPVFANGGGRSNSPQKLHDTYMGYAKNYRDKAVKIEKKAGEYGPEKAATCKSLAEIYRLMGDEKEKMANAYLNEDAKAGAAARATYGELRKKRTALEQELWGGKCVKKKKASQKAKVAAKNTRSDKAKDKEIAELKAQLEKLSKRLEAVEAKK